MSACERALDNLLAWEPEKESRRRSEAKDAVADLVQRASSFARRLAADGQDEDLTRLATRFETLTGTDSTFDSARMAAHGELSKPDMALYLPDESATPSRPRRRILDLGDDSFSASPRGEDRYYPNRLIAIGERLADQELTRWDLATALKDAKAILDLELTPEQKT
jgi:hypothetical protein